MKDESVRKNTHAQSHDTGGLFDFIRKIYQSEMNGKNI